MNEQRLYKRNSRKAPSKDGQDLIKEFADGAKKTLEIAKVIGKKSNAKV